MAAPPEGSRPAAPPLFDRDLKVPGLAANQRAFNAGMARHMGEVVMVFRLETRLGHPAAPQGGRHSQLAAMRLSADFMPVGDFTVLETPRAPHTFHTAEDPRPFDFYGRLMVVFSLSDSGQASGPRHIHLGEICRRQERGESRLEMAATWRLSFAPPGAPVPRVEKNWSPFVFGRHLHFLYRSSPNLVLRLQADPRQAPAGSTLYPVALERLSQVPLAWPAGEPRGGTQAIYDRRLDRYVTFFHSAHKDIGLVGRRGQPSLTYFFGCCLFHSRPPFDIDRASSEPIACSALVRELLRRGESEGKRIVFVQGLVADAERFVLSFGRGDAHIGVCSLARHAVLQSLRPAGRQRRLQPAARPS